MDEEMNNEELDNIVTLKSEDGKDVKFEFLDLIEYQGGNYVVLLPVSDDGSEEGEEVVILKEEGITEDGQDESYASVDDEKVLNSVFEIFKDKFKDEFNFED
jgi:uncharacterized protein YrzB (UPF0473 family)